KAPGGFRAFFYGVIRNVARRAESRHGRRRDRQPPTAFFGETAEASEQRLSRVFDRDWARAMMREAADLQREAAQAAGPDAQRRVELLLSEVVAFHHPGSADAIERECAELLSLLE
ncbi:MAG: sigma-70 family RNA polymerase sigma factor, partial [Planctomycetota bacterium]